MTDEGTLFSKPISNKNKLDKLDNILIDGEHKKKLNFSTTYLTISEQIILAVNLKRKMFLNNKKTIFFLLSSPLVFCILLYFINFLYLFYSSSKHTLNPTIYSVSMNETISLKCDFPKGCISIGIILLVI